MYRIGRSEREDSTLSEIGNWDLAPARRRQLQCGPTTAVPESLKREAQVGRELASFDDPDFEGVSIYACRRVERFPQYD